MSFASVLLVVYIPLVFPYQNTEQPMIKVDMIDNVCTKRQGLSQILNSISNNPKTGLNLSSGSRKDTVVQDRRDLNPVEAEYFKGPYSKVKIHMPIDSKVKAEKEFNIDPGLVSPPELPHKRVKRAPKTTTSAMQQRKVQRINLFKKKTCELMEQSMYAAQEILWNVEPILKKYETHVPYRMAFIFLKMETALHEINAMLKMTNLWRLPFRQDALSTSIGGDRSRSNLNTWFTPSKRIQWFWQMQKRNRDLSFMVDYIIHRVPLGYEGKDLIINRGGRRFFKDNERIEETSSMSRPDRGRRRSPDLRGYRKGLEESLKTIDVTSYLKNYQDKFDLKESAVKPGAAGKVEKKAAAINAQKESRILFTGKKSALGNEAQVKQTTGKSLTQRTTVKKKFLHGTTLARPPFLDHTSYQNNLVEAFKRRVQE